MKKRQKEIERVYEEQWDGGKGSHHPDYDPEAVSWLGASWGMTERRKGAVSTKSQHRTTPRY